MLSHVVEPFGEWSTLLPDRALSAPAVYSSIQSTIRRSQLPAQVTAVRAVQDCGAFSVVANRLVVVDEPFTINVFVYPYGTSLYMGWTMYRRRSGPAILQAALVEFERSLRSRLEPERADSVEVAGALRDAVHAACLDGCMEAARNIAAPVDQHVASVSIHLVDERGADRLETAVEAFLADHGFEVVSKSEPVISG
jgi:hypothetical protein